MKKGFFSKIVVRWYLANRRNLPWRSASDPYKIWLSEIILQQTRVIQGLPYYQRFIKKFPTVGVLASAPLSVVLRLWQGLGYYSRARNLHRCAQVISRDYQSLFPADFDELRKLPGIGEYTAAAIASIAFHQPVAVIDGNVYRVLSRVFGIEADITSPSGKKIFRDKANELLDPHNAGTYNQALMEFGALQCVPRNPDCETCALKGVCFAFIHSLQETFPVKKRKVKVSHRYITYFLLRRQGKILMKERTQKDIWKGLFDLPMLEARVKQSPKKAVAQFFGSDFDADLVNIRSYQHKLTHQVLHVSIIEIPWTSHRRLPDSVKRYPGSWFSAAQIAELPKPILIDQDFRNRRIL